MSIKPILFNTDMVRAILDGRKTATRRVIKPQPKFSLCYTYAGHNYGTWTYPSDSAYVYWGEEYRLPDSITEDDKKMVWKPPYHADDILYVRETWCLRYDGEKYFYKSDKNTAREDKRLLDYDHVSWKPSIHMPKEAARIFIKVTNVRVERLQDITDEQAKAEGANWKNGKNVGFEEKMRRTSVERFAEIWDSTIKKSDLDRYGWDANPWVWVIEFERCQKPEEWLECLHR